MTEPAPSAETFTVRLDAFDVRRILVQGTSAVGREATPGGVSIGVNIVAWAAMSIGVGAFFRLYEKAPETRALLVLAAVALTLGFLTAGIWWARWNTLVLRGLVRDASWLTREQTVTVDDAGVKVEADGFRFWYDWSLFTRLQESADAFLLGGGGQPVVVVPTSGEVSSARLAWIRHRVTGAVSSDGWSGADVTPDAADSRSADAWSSAHAHAHER